MKLLITKKSKQRVVSNYNKYFKKINKNMIPYFYYPKINK